MEQFDHNLSQNSVNQRLSVLQWGHARWTAETGKDSRAPHWLQLIRLMNWE
jgi:hypothetical protein